MDKGSSPEMKKSSFYRLENKDKYYTVKTLNPNIK